MNIRKLTIILASMILFVFSAAQAQQINIPGTTVTFTPPAGFAPLSQEIMNIKWSSSRAPRFAVGNETASTTIAYDLKNNRISQRELPKMLESFSDLFPRMIPGLVWKKKEIITLDGKSWLYLEMTSNAIDTDIYNIMLATDYNGQMILFNFNSTREDFPRYEHALRQSVNSIQLNE